MLIPVTIVRGISAPVRMAVLVAVLGLFRPLPAAGVDAVLGGDLDGSGSVDVFDLLEMLTILSEGTDSADKRRVRIADLQGDGRVDIFDLLAQLRLIAGRDRPRPVLFHTPVAGCWALGDGEKVYRGDTHHFSRDSNGVFDGREIAVRGLYNEVLGLQVIVAADSSGAEGVEIRLDSLVHDSSGAVLGSAAEVKYGSSGDIELFGQHYLHVTAPTRPNWFYGPNAPPERMTGWIPDALIPPDAAPGLGGFPLDVPPDSVQGFWIDIYLPRDTVAMPAGTYRGVVRVLQQDVQVDSLTVRLELLPAYLPDENSTWTWMFHSGVQRYFPGVEREEVDRWMHHLAHRHRIDLAGGFAPHGGPFSKTEMADYRPWLDGSGYTEEAGYQGPGQGRGERIFPIGMYGGYVLGNTADSVRAESDKWVSWFDSNAPDARYFWYLIDEPGEDRYDWIRDRSGWVKDNPGPGKDLPVFITESYQSGLHDYIDIWCGFFGVDTDRMEQLRQEGKDYWYYNGGRPRYGSVILEAAAVDLRVNHWVNYIFDIDVWFLWHGTHWRHNHQGPRAHTDQNVFVDPVTFISGPASFGNGDGVVFYPGRNPYYPEQDRGLDRVLGSIRLKNIRRGHQDHELMRMAGQMVGRDAVLELVREAVPRAMDEVRTDEIMRWSQRGADYDRIRHSLLEIIAGMN